MRQGATRRSVKPNRQCLRTALVLVLLSLLEGKSSSSSNNLYDYSTNGAPRHESTFGSNRPYTHPHHHQHSHYEQSHVDWHQIQRQDPQLPDRSSIEDSWDESSSPNWSSFRLGPPPPQELPLRFLRAGKNDPAEGWRRYQDTLTWRREHGVDNILREAFPEFHVIKRHFQQYFHGLGRKGEPTFYERPGKTNVRALKQAGVDMNRYLRFYTFLTEFQWQMLSPDDHAQSMYVVDLEGIRFSDFVGETRDFIMSAAKMSAQHYPERGGKVFLLNAPRWFHAVWQVIRTIVDESTLDKIFILPRGQRPEEIRNRLLQYIPLENIPREYGGTSPVPLGQSNEEQLLANLAAHNNQLAHERRAVCRGCGSQNHPDQWPCGFCRWTPVRSY